MAHDRVREQARHSVLLHSTAAFLSYGNINTFTSRIETAIGWRAFFLVVKRNIAAGGHLLIRRRNLLPFLVILVMVLARSDLLCVEWVTDHQSCARFISVDGSTNRNALKCR